MPQLPTGLDPASLSPLLSFVGGLDLTAPGEARAALNTAFPMDGDWVAALRTTLVAAAEAGEVCNRGAPPVRWSRVFRAGDESAGLSADAVWMNGPGPRHEHPNGEVDLCFSLEGDPRFDGEPEGWVVYGPGSRHVPTVSGGDMLILYLLPGGAIEFL